MNSKPHTITVNGKIYPYKDDCSVATLLAELGITPAHMAIERNGTIVPAESLEEVFLQPDDTIEIIQFVGGG